MKPVKEKNQKSSGRMAQLSEFRKIVEEHQGMLYRLAYRLAGNHEDAEDLSQEVFIKVYNKMDSFRGDAQLSTWIYRIAVNTWIDKKRIKKHASDTIHIEYEDTQHTLGSDNNPEAFAEYSQLQQDIQHALNLLSDREKTVFVLKHYQQLKLKEIANILEVSTGTVKSTMFRAMTKLRDALEAYQQERS